MSSPRMYAIRPVVGGPIKVGRASDPVARLAQIQPCSPTPLELLGHVEETAELCETTEHRRLAAHRLHGEWFDITPRDLPWLGATAAPADEMTPGRRTHCKRGHAFTIENTYVHPDGRQCRTCARLRSQSAGASARLELVNGGRA